jgi:putative PIN family toxin of toxin-antitoxin system
MVFLQGAARAAGPAAACVRLAEQGFVQLCLSREVLAEVREVLSRPRLRQQFPSLIEERVAAFLGAVLQGALVVEDAPAAITFERDPKDEKYLNLVVAVGAEILVSRDNDLLDLRSDTNPTGLELRRHVPALRILDPVEFLLEMRSRTPPASPTAGSSGEKPPNAE